MPGFLRSVAAIIPLLLALSNTWAASPPQPDQVFQLRASRDDTRLKLMWTIAPGNYLYRAMIRANKAPPADEPIAVITPSGEPKDDPNFGSQEIYRDLVVANIEASEIQGTNQIILTYQGCAETFHICYPPIRKILNVQKLNISNEAPTHAAISGGRTPNFVEAPPDVLSESSVIGGGVRKMFSSSWFDVGGMLASFFGLGVLLSFSPCTFPLVPIFFGILARSRQPTTKFRNVGLAAVFVVASASAYSSLGAFAARSGSGANLQILLQTPIALGAMSAILIALAMSMFGLFELQLPAGLANRISAAGPADGHGPVFTAAVLGFVSTLIASPCVTPPLATALLYVAHSGNVARGMAALFLFGIGLGVPLLTFGALGPNFLPKPGPWLVRVRHAIGFILLTIALAVLARVLPLRLALQFWGLLAVAGSVYLGKQLLAADGGSRFGWMGLASIALMVGSIFLVGSTGDHDAYATRILNRLVSSYSEADDSVRIVPSVQALDHELDVARRDNKPVMLDFTADWCVECKLVDKDLRRPDLKESLERFRVLRADVTAVDADSRALMDKYEVVGPPTILLFGPKNKGKPEVRIIGSADANTLQDKFSTVAADDE